MKENSKAVAVVVEDSISEQSAKSIFKDIGETGVSIFVTRIPVVVNVFSNGVIFAQLGGKQASANVYSNTVTFAVMGTFRALVAATGPVVGELRRAGNLEEAGKTLHRAWALGLMLSILTVGIHLSVKPILLSASIDEEVAAYAQDFCSAILVGLPAAYWMPADLAFAVGIGKPLMVPLAGIIYSGVSMVVGYPLALRYGIAWMGYGVGIGAWASLIFLRSFFYFFCREEVERYGIFRFQFDLNPSNYLKLIRRGLASALLNLFDWGNLFTVSLMVGSLGSQENIAMNVALQPVSSYGVLLSGFTQGLGIGVATYLGMLQRCGNDESKRSVVIRNMNKFANYGVFISVATSTLVGVTFISAHQSLSNIFAGTAEVDHSLIFEMQLLNYLVLTFESVRNIYTAMLIGSNDTYAPIRITFFSLILMSTFVCGVPSILFQKSATWLFFYRDLGLIGASIGLGYRWYKNIQALSETPLLSASAEDKEAEASDRIEEAVAEDPELEIERPSSFWNFFRCKKIPRQSGGNDIQNNKSLCLLM